MHIYIERKLKAKQIEQKNANLSQLVNEESKKIQPYTQA